jgi:hypothetical protein
MLRVAFALVVAASIALYWSQRPGHALTTAEVDGYLDRIAPTLPLSALEKADFLGRLRAWGEADDGKPVFMLNLMRYYDHLRDLPGLGDVARTPREANAYYESVATPLLLKRGGYALFAGVPQGIRSGRDASTNILGYDSDLENWSRVLVVRYPARRAFFELLSDPAYIAVMPYKLAALNVALVPLTDELTVPDVRWMAGAFALAAVALAVVLRTTRPTAAP